MTHQLYCQPCNRIIPFDHPSEARERRCPTCGGIPSPVLPSSAPVVTEDLPVELVAETPAPDEDASEGDDSSETSRGRKRRAK
jgi:hypothetical protein